MSPHQFALVARTRADSPQTERRPVTAAPIDPSLVVGAAHDPAEAEADRVAAEVVRRLSAGPEDADVEPAVVVPRAPVARAHEHGGGMGMEGGPVDADTGAEIRGRTGSGQPLDVGVRRSMEGAFGADFSRVRVHRDAAANQLNRRIAAKAFTTGNDIFFRNDAAAPTTSAGQELLAHELTHVVQGTPTQVHRKIDVTQVERIGKYLGVKKPIQLVEVPKARTTKTVTFFKDYPDANKLNLSAKLLATNLLLMNYPASANDPDGNFNDMRAEPATSIVVDLLGGGAYNLEWDLVVLKEGYTEPELLHEMGHKAQGEAGISAETASVLFLEYHNVVIQQNGPWNAKEEGAPEPRLFYNPDGPNYGAVKAATKINSAAEVTDEKWEAFKKTVATSLHHSPEDNRLEVLEAIEHTLGGRYAQTPHAKGRLDLQVKYNLMAEYYSNL